MFGSGFDSFNSFTEEEEQRINDAVEEDRRRRHEQEIQDEINRRIAEDRANSGY